jgi:hypothetical protein
MSIELAGRARAPRRFESYAGDEREQIDAIRWTPELDDASGGCEIVHRQGKVSESKML